MTEEGYVIDGEPKIIRRMRFYKAKIINISVDAKDFTYSAFVPSAHGKDGKTVTRWAFYDNEQIEITLTRAIDEDTKVNLLVHRKLFTYSKKGETKKKYNMHDFVVGASLSI